MGSAFLSLAVEGSSSVKLSCVALRLHRSLDVSAMIIVSKITSFAFVVKLR